MFSLVVLLQSVWFIIRATYYKWNGLFEIMVTILHLFLSSFYDLIFYGIYLKKKHHVKSPKLINL